MAFLLRNEAGNAFRRTDSKVKRDRLVAAGYVDVTEQIVDETHDADAVNVAGVSSDVTVAQTTPPKKGKGAGKADKE